jgi:hypothetical protein
MMTEKDLAAFDRESERRQRDADFAAAHPEYAARPLGAQPDGSFEGVAFDRHGRAVRVCVPSNALRFPHGSLGEEVAA